MPPPKYRIYAAGLITLFGLGGLGLALLLLFQQQSFRTIFLHQQISIWKQIGTGLLYGLFASGLLLLLLRKKILQSTKIFFADMLNAYNISIFDVLFLSSCAGIGEELLFRAALQPWFGIWLTAIIFIALHGYLDPRDRPMLLYGTVLLIISGGFGYLMKYCGIWSAMAAHSIVDVVLIADMRRHKIK